MIIQWNLQLIKSKSKRVIVCNTKERIVQVTLHLCRTKTKSLRQKTKNKRKSVTKIKYLFQGQSAKSQHWFKLGPEWIEVFFDQGAVFLQKALSKNIPGLADKDWITFSVPIRSTK